MKIARDQGVLFDPLGAVTKQMRQPCCMRACEHRHRLGSEEARCLKEIELVDGIGNQRAAVEPRAGFDHHARDLLLAEVFEQSPKPSAPLCLCIDWEEARPPGG